MTATPTIPLLTQNDGRRIPQIGLGIYGPDDDGTVDAVHTALDLGYRSIDTAALYRNEWGVGEGMRRSGAPREEIYLTTKLPDPDHGYDEARRAFDASLKRLGLEYVDLYLIHWPLPGVDRYAETWRAFEAIQADGLTPTTADEESQATAEPGSNLFRGSTWAIDRR
jgi:2,5-diketo-D-gluconate reductase A